MEMRLRPMTDADRSEVAELIYVSLNHWHQTHGRGPTFTAGPSVTEIYYDVYKVVSPGCTIVAENPRTGRLLGSCFYHPREHHVSLGVMNAHPNYFGLGVARALMQHIIDYTESHGYKALRLTSSAINLDSYSLYNRGGFVPRLLFHDMILPVPPDGMKRTLPGMDKVRDATPADIPAMGALEMDVSGILREGDYRYCIENALGIWHTSVYESSHGDIDGFMISCSHPANNILGPCVARTEEAAAALILRELDHHKGRTPVFLVPAERTNLVRQAYEWGARNCELHLCQVRGEFKPFQGISMPTFLPETG
jgi:GNAT superfamily N-acetyltransferase